MSESPKNVALFVTCLVDLFRPSVGFAAIKLMEDAGCTVAVPDVQTCCGQPAYNLGDASTTTEIAKNVITAFEGYDYVVAPSGSCASMIKEHYPRLLEGRGGWQEKAQNLAARTHELMTYLVDVLGITEIQGSHNGTAAYHDSCSGLRELGIKAQPRSLLRGINGLRLEEYDGAESCCGFGGTFCVKYTDISNKMVSARVDQLKSINANMLLGGDLGCLFNLAGKLKREGSAVQVRHAAEVLAGTTNLPPIANGAE